MLEVLVLGKFQPFTTSFSHLVISLRVAPECEFCHDMVPEIGAKNGLVDQQLVLGPLVEPRLTALEKEQEDIDTSNVLRHGCSKVLDESSITAIGVSKTLSICKIYCSLKCIILINLIAALSTYQL